MAAVALGAVDRAGLATAATVGGYFPGITIGFAPGRRAEAPATLCTLSWPHLEAAKNRALQHGQEIQLQHMACRRASDSSLPKIIKQV